jgi:hypothetical protein
VDWPACKVTQPGLEGLVPQTLTDPSRQITVVESAVEMTMTSVPTTPITAVWVFVWKLAPELAASSFLTMSKY